jgi:hypothetical protein
MDSSQTDEIASPCLLCRTPVRTPGALHCGSLCRLVWKRLRFLHSAESSRPLADDIPVILDRLKTCRPLQVGQWQRLPAWASERPG